MLIKSSHRMSGHLKMEREKEDHEISEKEDSGDERDPDKEFVKKMESYAGQLKQLGNMTHPEYCKVSNRTATWLSEQQQRIQILHDHKIDEIHRQYKSEIEACERECTLEKKKIQEYLISLCEDLKRRLEFDVKGIELTTTGDVLEIKPTVTRKLRRRTPEVPASLLMNRGSAGQVGSMVLGGVSGSSSGPNGANKFGYWADMQLYAPRWSPSPFKTTAAAPTDPLSPPDTALDENPPPSSAFAAHHQHHIPSNLFGSLGLNIDDGNCLVGHLVASLSMPGSVDGASIMNSMLTQHSGNNSCSSVASVAAAIVPSLSAGFMAPKRQKKNSSQPMTQLSLLLSETDIYSDLTSIHRTCGKPPSSERSAKKHGLGDGDGRGIVVSPSRDGDGTETSPTAAPASSRRRGAAAGGGDSETAAASRHRHHHHGHHNQQQQHSPPAPPPPPPSHETSGPAIWIDDGRLYIGQTCYQQGTPVHLDSHGCSGTVIAVGAQDISIKRRSDLGIMRITVQQLKHGRYVLAPLKHRRQ